MILEPVVKWLGRLMKLKFWLIYKQISMANLDKVEAKPAIANATVFSDFPRLICAATELYFNVANSNS
ncbi:hypothetical protein D3C72_2349850 [compost metagenome]